MSHNQHEPEPPPPEVMITQSINSSDHSMVHHTYSSSNGPNTPIGVSIFGSCFRFDSQKSKRNFHQILLLFITFIAYGTYHCGRRPLSIVKNVLNRNCSDIHHLDLNTNINLAGNINDPDYGLSPIPGTIDQLYDGSGIIMSSTSATPPATDTSCDWAPFNNDETANQLLAQLDSAFLFSYAFFMFFSGYLADRCNLRYFLSAGMILSGFLLYAFGMAYYLNIHSMTYFVIIQILSGAIQTTGWPAVVTCVGNWFDQSSRGYIFGLWNSNTNFGNILGAVIAGYFVEQSWGLSFIVPGFIMSACGVLTFLFLVPKPEDVNLHPLKTGHGDKRAVNNYRDQDIEEAIRTMVPNGGGGGGGDDDNDEEYRTSRRKLPRPTSRDSAVSNDQTYNSTIQTDGEASPLISSSNTSLSGQESGGNLHAVSFWTCLAIPGVIEYSLCLGFAKLVSYTFLYWLPRYITSSTTLNSEESAYLSTPFDVGGMFGAIIAGYLCDRYKKSGTVCVVMLVLAIPAMLTYEQFASLSNYHNIALQLLAGSMVNGPYALITTAVSTDLGGRIKDGKAMATVAAIIDGTGSIGAAIGPLFAGYVSSEGWQSVFMMLMLSDLLAALCLTRVFLKEMGFR
uniref:Sugar phosphate exchanger 2 n=1 Tax=Aceria tosichella TaxID=561515 RepID=A0A6G1SG22_9ACAR